jgi:hypothetical protein
MGKSLGLQQNAPGYHPIFGAHGERWAIQTWITIHKKKPMKIEFFTETGCQYFLTNIGALIGG